MITPTASTTAIIRTSARLAASPFADASYYTLCRGSTRLGGAKRQRRHAPAHRGPAPGASRRPQPSADAAVARFDKDLGSTMKAMVRDGLLRRVETVRYTTVTA